MPQLKNYNEKPTHMRKRSSSHIKIVLAAPNPMTSFLLAQALEKTQDFLVVDRISDAGRLSASLDEHGPSVLLVSIHMETLVSDRFLELSNITAAHPDLACVVLLDHDNRETVVDAFRARAKGVFVCAESHTEMLQKCIHRVVEGEIWADSSQVSYVVAALPSVHARESTSKRKILNVLTPREEEVVWQLAEGLSNREVAARLSLSENTVKNYVFRIFEKLGFSNRVEVVLYAATRMQQHQQTQEPQPLQTMPGSSLLRGAEAQSAMRATLPRRATESVKERAAYSS
jgi:two-component system nitrate/nitrite response regulator NarL